MKRRLNPKSKAILIVALLLAASEGRQALGSAPSVSCVMAFGSGTPTAWCDERAAGTLTPTSQPFGSVFERGTLFVRGVSSPGYSVIVSATDGIRSVSRTVTTLTKDAPSEGLAAGSFSAELPVFDLGVHRVAEGALPDSAPESDRGLSILTVRAAAIDPATGKPGDARTATVVKLAASLRDVYPPTVLEVVWPPSMWCHLTCGALNCYSFSTPGGEVTSGEEGGQCRTRVFGTDIGQGVPRIVPTGDSVVRGRVEDRGPGEQESEIADVIVQINRGSEILRGPFSAVTRSSSVMARWNVPLRIDDFEPNFLPGDPKYTVLVTITDAWGHSVELLSPEITVYPF